MSTRQPLGARTATTDNQIRGGFSLSSHTPTAAAPFTPSKSPHHSRHQASMSQRTSNPTTAQTTTQPQTQRQLTRQVSTTAIDHHQPPLASQHHSSNSNATNLVHTTQREQQRSGGEDPNDFSQLYNRRDLPRSPLSPVQLLTIFEKWLMEYRINREKLTQIRAQNSQKQALWAQQQSTQHALSLTNGPNAPSPAAIPINESASIQALFTPVFFQSVIYIFRALLFKHPTSITLEHLDTIVEIALYGLHMQDLHIKHASCLMLREITESTPLTTPQSPRTQPHSLLQQSVIGSVIKPITQSRTNAIYGPVFDDLEVTTRLLCQHLHFSLAPELCRLIQQQLNQVYTPQLLSYIRSLFYSFQCGRAVLYTNGADSTIKFKQHDVDVLMSVIVQLCTYQGYSRTTSTSYQSSNCHGTSGDLGEIRIYGGALLRSIGGTFPLTKTLAAVKSLQPSYQVIIGDVCSRVLQTHANSPDVTDEVIMKRLLYTVRNSGTTPPPTTLPSFTAFIDSTPNQLPNLSEGTGNNLLEHNPFEINHTFQAFNIVQTGASLKSEHYYQSLYDHTDRTIYIPYLLVGPAQGHSRASVDKMMGKGTKTKNEEDMMTWSEALGDRSLDKLNSSQNSILSEVGSIQEIGSVGGDDSFRAGRNSGQMGMGQQFDQQFNQPQPHQTLTRTKTVPTPQHVEQQVKYVTETICKEVSVPSMIGCFGSQHPHPKHAQTNQNATYTSLDREADALIQMYQAFKSDPTSLTKANFEFMMGTSQKITKAMFTISTYQLQHEQNNQNTNGAGNNNNNGHNNTSNLKNGSKSTQVTNSTSTPTTTSNLNFGGGIAPIRKKSVRISNQSKGAVSPPQMAQKRVLLDRNDFDCGSDEDNNMRSSGSSIIRRSNGNCSVQLDPRGQDYHHRPSSINPGPLGPNLNQFNQNFGLFSDNSDDDDLIAPAKSNRPSGNYSLRASTESNKKQRLGF